MRASAQAVLIAVLSHPAFAQSVFAQTGPKFEVTDVHRTERLPNPYTFLSGGVLRGTRYDLRKATLLDLIRRAYDVPAEKIIGGPNWLEFDRFDIAAKAPASTSPETIKLMLQALLADRFGLVVHKDMKPVPAYAIVAGKDKPKLTAAAGEDPPQCTYIRQPNGSTFTEYHCHNMTMQVFAENLRSMASDYLVQSVVDATGIQGAWDFDLRWNQRSQALPVGTERTTIFDAMRKQFGLTLDLQTAPAPVLVIDHVDAKPTASAANVAQLLPPLTLEFEVATVRKSPDDEQECCFQVTPRGDLEAQAIPLRVLIGAAWDMDWDHTDVNISGLPDWTNSARFDVKGKAAVATNGPPPNGAGYIEDDVRLMLRALLIERFHIEFHYEDRAVNAYVLVNVKSKLKKADPARRGSCNDSPNLENDPRDRNPLLSRLLACQSTSMAQFAVKLQSLASDQFVFPVEDATGLTGAWDFTLNFTPAWMLRNAQSIPSPVGASEPLNGISLADALNKQMGLKLEMRKRTLPILVIDHMERTPDEN